MVYHSRASGESHVLLTRRVRVQGDSAAARTDSPFARKSLMILSSWIVQSGGFPLCCAIPNVENERVHEQGRSATMSLVTQEKSFGTMVAATTQHNGFSQKIA